MRRFLFPSVTGLVMLGIWWGLSAEHVFPVGTVPPPDEVAVTLWDELRSGRLLDETIASLFRIAWGFVMAVVAAVPLGLVVGRSAVARAFLMPWINFFRSMSPIAWIPFAIIAFGIGDPPAIFLIFLATFFQVVLATAAAAAAVPSVYYRVAEDLGMSKRDILFRVTLPAIAPQLVIALRVAIGVAWMVVVAAEMIGVQSGLGYLIQEGRDLLNMTLVIAGMITIGVIGIALDLVFARLAHIPSVRWGFDR